MTQIAPPEAEAKEFFKDPGLGWNILILLLSAAVGAVVFLAYMHAHPYSVNALAAGFMFSMGTIGAFIVVYPFACWLNALWHTHTGRRQLGYVAVGFVVIVDYLTNTPLVDRMYTPIWWAISSMVALQVIALVIAIIMLIKLSLTKPHERTP